ncbi:MAG: ATP-binding cassette domain-containing protein [Parcubacteria group bacterium]|nr:ATP-binding cassette domain-containing protein [Parcubacteria group bacterium]
MIAVKELTKNYGGAAAVDQVSFEIRKGEIVGLLGPNGAGKTTTMRMLTGYLPPTNGEIKIGGLDASQNPIKVREKIGYLPENNPVYAEMSVVEYLGFAGEMRHLPKTKIRERTRKVLKDCGLSDKAYEDIGRLSKGYRQRVGLAQALLSDPEVLILDEPTVGLDPNQIVEIRELIKKAGKEKTVLLSSHILAEVEATCDRVLIIHKGKIAAEGTPAELRARASGQSKIILKVEIKPDRDLSAALAEVPGITGKRSIKSHEAGVEVLELDIEAGRDARKELVNFLFKNGFQLLEISRQELKLEDIFSQLTR